MSIEDGRGGRALAWGVDWWDMVLIPAGILAQKSCFQLLHPSTRLSTLFVVREVMAGRLRGLWASKKKRSRKSLLEHGMGIADQEAPCAFGRRVAHTHACSH
jgi:hypothetical protein